MADVFVSYSREDRELASRLVRALKADGIRVWWDEDLLSGEFFRKRLADEIDRARCVVVLWSASSVESDWVLDEAQLANDGNVCIQASLDGARAPMGYRQRHCADLSGWDGSPEATAYRQVREAIDLVLSRVRVMPVQLVLVTADKQVRPEMGPTANMIFRLFNDSESAIELDWLALTARSDDETEFYLVPRLLFNARGGEHEKVPSNWNIVIDARSTVEIGMQFRDPRADLPNPWPVGAYRFELAGWVNSDHNVDLSNLRTTFQGEVSWQNPEMTRWRDASMEEWDESGASDRAWGFPLLMQSITIG